MIGHSLGVEDPVEVVAFVLHDPGVKAFDLPLDRLAGGSGPAIADPQMPRHDATQPGNREAPLPTKCPLPPEHLDHRIDEHCQILSDVPRQLGDALVGNTEDYNP